MLANPITAPDAIVRFPTLPVFSDIHAMFKGCVYGQDCTTQAAKYLITTKSNDFQNGFGLYSDAYLTPLLVLGGKARKRIHPTNCHAAVIRM